MLGVLMFPQFRSVTLTRLSDGTCILRLVTTDRDVIEMHLQNLGEAAGLVAMMRAAVQREEGE